MDTKQKIVSTAVECFNDKGYGAITLNDIAKSLGVSRGHIAYHFKSKDILLEYIATEMWDQLDLERAKTLSFPSFENLTKMMSVFQKYYKQYSFIFMDAQVTSHPLLQPMIEQKSKEGIEDNMRTISFSVELGNMKPEPFEGAYYNLSVQFWIIAFFWFHQIRFRSDAEQEDMMKMGWSLLIPHFTPKGLEAFTEYFGQDYYNQLGQGRLKVKSFGI